MKSKSFVAIILMFSFGFASQATCQLSENQKEQIKSQIKAVCDSIIAEAGRHETDCIQYYSDSPDWTCINSDGSRSDFQTFKKSNLDFIADMADFKWTTDLQTFPLITDQIAVCTWIGHAEVSLKSGDKLFYNPDVNTYIFRRIAGNWKVFYTQESCTVTTQKAEKK